MKLSRAYAVNVITTGYIVLTLFSLALFWPVWCCNLYLNSGIDHNATYIHARPSRLLPMEIEDAPDVAQHSYTSAQYRPVQPLFTNLGIAAYPAGRMPGGPAWDVYMAKWSDTYEPDLVYLDSGAGQIVSTRYHVQQSANGRPRAVRLTLYAGPDGMSDKPDRTLGRFHSLIVSLGQGPDVWFAYDKKLQRFFAIDFARKTVVKGPELPKDEPHIPIQIGSLIKQEQSVWLQWRPPYVRAKPGQIVQGYEVRENDTRLVPIKDQYMMGLPFGLLLVLDATGRIDLLDTKTLQFIGIAGRLPIPQSLFSTPGTVRPKDLSAYQIMPLYDLSDKTYRGCFTAAVSREATSAALAVFDDKGTPLYYQTSKGDAYYQDTAGRGTRDIPSSSVALFGKPWAPTVTSIRYLLENLHPPALSLVTYMTAWRFEATSAFRSIFILPNSFIAMKGRDTENPASMRLWGAVLLIAPSIVLAVILAWRIGKNAASLGYSQNAAVCWVLATFAFGLVGYITYRLTRPKAALVTCQNCGKPRRPDMERCHRCRSPWDIPELAPPSWRVLDGTN